MNWVPYPWSTPEGQRACQDLSGRLIKIVRPGEMVPAVIKPGQITVMVDKNEHVVSFTVDPGLPDR